MTTQNGKMSWADIEDDDYVQDVIEEVVIQDEDEERSSDHVATTVNDAGRTRRMKKSSRVYESQRQYPIWFHPHTSTMCRVLYDIHGHPLLDDDGNCLHVWNATLRDYLERKRVRFHSSGNQRKPFSWFTTNETQAREFSDALRTGKGPTNRAYHVYVYEPDTPLPWGN